MLAMMSPKVGRLARSGKMTKNVLQSETDLSSEKLELLGSNIETISLTVSSTDNDQHMVATQHLDGGIVQHTCMFAFCYLK